MKRALSVSLCRKRRRKKNRNRRKVMSKRTMRIVRMRINNEANMKKKMKRKAISK
jgi:hypothetical protein